MPYLLSIVTAAAIAAQSATPVTVTAYVVSIEKRVLTVSNRPLGPAVAVPPVGDVFTMPAPKEGEPAGTWVAAAPDSAEPRPAEAPDAPGPRRMAMAAGDGAELLTLTSIQLSDEQAAALEVSTGTALRITYREIDGKKHADRIERLP